jgi:sugar fermentation stimulation protein A
VVLLSDSGGQSRRHPLTWEITELPTGSVCINSALCRRLMIDAVESRSIPSLAFFHELQRDAESGLHGTVDILLHGMEHNGYVNLYGATWAEGETALFPDAQSRKAVASLRRLTGLAGQGHRATAFFLVQRGDCRLFKPAEAVDRDFMKAMLAAQSAGVELLVYGTAVSPAGITLGAPLPLSLA